MGKKYLRFIIYILEIYIFNSLNHFSSYFIFLVPIFVSISIFERGYLNIVLGVISGILTDVSFGGVVGVSALLFGLTSWFLNKVFSEFLRPNFLIFSFVSVVATFVAVFLNLFSVCGFKASEVMFGNCLKVSIFTVFASFPIYFFNRMIFYGLKEKADEF